MTLPNGTVLTQVSRASVLARIAAIPLGVIPYSKSTISPVTGRRADCTGWLSYVWATPHTGPGIYLRGYNTGSFYTQRVIGRIQWADLQPGDAVGYFAADSPGNGGHAAIWMDGDKRPDGRFQVSDHGSGDGPKLRWVRWTGVYTGGWMDPGHIGAWRYVGITEHDEGGGDIMLCKKGDQGPAVEAMQRLLMVAGATLPRFGPDGDYGAETIAALKALLAGSGEVYGPVEYVALMQRAMRGMVGPAGPVGPRGPAGPVGPPGPGIAVGDQLTIEIKQAS